MSRYVVSGLMRCREDKSAVLLFYLRNKRRRCHPVRWEIVRLVVWEFGSDVEIYWHSNASWGRGVFEDLLSVELLFGCENFFLVVVCCCAKLG
jgi:hypothetical protein